MSNVDARQDLAPALPSLPARFVGVLTSPGSTFRLVAASPRSLGMLAATVMVTVVMGTGFLSTDVGRQALLDQQVASLESFGVVVTDEQYAQLQDRLSFAAEIQAAISIVGIPLAALAVSGLFFGVLSGPLGGKASYRQVLAVVAHSGAVGVVQQLFVTPLNYARESMSNPSNLGVFFPMLDEGGFLASFLGTIDLFVVWWSVVLAIGLGVLYQRKAGSIATWLFGVYGVIALVVAALKTALGGQ